VELLSVSRRISMAAEFYGRVLRDTPNPDPAFIEAALEFWDEVLRRQMLEGVGYLGFGWWSEAVAIEDSAWLDRIFETLKRTNGRIDWEDEVVKRLIQLPDRPEAWRALALLVRGAPDRWSVSYWARNLQSMFDRTAESPEPIRSRGRSSPSGCWSESCWTFVDT
jgi:hypothetical protein